jgi:hypothetical protein
MTWSTNTTTVNFVVDEEVLGVGGFCEVFKATSDTHEFADSIWVVKKYLPEAITVIGKTNQTVEEQLVKKLKEAHAGQKPCRAASEET